MLPLTVMSDITDTSLTDKTAISVFVSYFTCSVSK